MTEQEKLRFICIVINIRNHQSRAWNQRTPNWVLLTNFFGLGSTSAYRWCRELGLDPDSHNGKPESPDPPQEATDET
jgi:hypothetical protein